MKIPVQIVLSRVISGSGNGYIKIEVADRNSGIHFCDLQIPLDQAYNLLSNSAFNAVADVRGLDLVGKHRLMKNVVLKLGNPGYGKDFQEAIEKAASECEKLDPDWIVSRYANSKNYNRNTDEFKTYANKYVDEAPQKAKEEDV